MLRSNVNKTSIVLLFCIKLKIFYSVTKNISFFQKLFQFDMDSRDSNVQQNLPTLCKNGCGFYANSGNEGLCSVCYKDFVKKKQAPPTNMPASFSKYINEMNVHCLLIIITYQVINHICIIQGTSK